MELVPHRNDPKGMEFSNNKSKIAPLTRKSKPIASHFGSLDFAPKIKWHRIIPMGKA
jgi:hypothetical protein